jgi:hypothetical protein
MRVFPVFLSFAIIFLALTSCFSGCTDKSRTNNNNTLTPEDSRDKWQIDHVVIVVSNLSVAKEKFTEAGFCVSQGGKHAGNVTENALILFKDGSYIELFAPVDPEFSEEMKSLVSSGNFDYAMKDLDAMDKRFLLHLAEGEGANL